MVIEKTNNKVPVLGLVVPCYNESPILATTAAVLREELENLVSQGLIAADSKVYFVDDGSSDGTWDIITGLIDAGGPFFGIRLSRNYGHQYALYAGLMEAEGDALVSLDADLQDDVAAIREMLSHYANGSEIVYGVRSDRASDSFFKRYSAELHYWITARMGIETIRNHADFRLMSRRAVEMLTGYRETQLYLRGLVPLLGLASSEVYYRRAERAAGESKYNFARMLSLSVKGITSFSITPLRIISITGLVVFLVSVGLGIRALHAALWEGGVVAGWASTVIPIYLLGGLQLLSIGVVGEYVGKIFIQVKSRPLYHVQELYSDSTRPSGPGDT